nr:retrotransposon protein, putative, unclassified [Tanacetum cinerariifolium]
EQGAGPNWLFDIDSLTKSINYVPVDAGTNSINLSESTSSKLYDESSSQVLEGSGNPNPTASAFNPLADQMETLTVASPISTMDVKSAFLYGTIDEEVYVMQPLGFHIPLYPTKVYKVEKAMYGLHQAPRA